MSKYDSIDQLGSNLRVKGLRDLQRSFALGNMKISSCLRFLVRDWWLIFLSEDC